MGGSQKGIWKTVLPSWLLGGNKFSVNVKNNNTCLSVYTSILQPHKLK